MVMYTNKIHTNTYTYIHTYIHIHTCIHTYIHTYMHTYMTHTQMYRILCQPAQKKNKNDKVKNKKSVLVGV